MFQYTDNNNNTVSEFQFSEVLIDCQLLYPLLDENLSIAERNLARFVFATTVSNEFTSLFSQWYANRSSWSTKLW